jgi:hypothetical protein
VSLNTLTPDREECFSIPQWGGALFPDQFFDWKSAMNQIQNQSNFFNLHVTGCGYLGRVRWVNPSKNRGNRRGGNEFLGCSIKALHGIANEANYSYFDVIVSGEKAIEIVNGLMVDVDAKRKVFVAFKVGDIYSDHYDRVVKDKHGNKTGEKVAASMIKGRLLLITHVAVDGEVTYHLDGDTSEPQDSCSESSKMHTDDEAVSLPKQTLRQKSDLLRKIISARPLTQKQPAVECEQEDLGYDLK